MARFSRNSWPDLPGGPPPPGTHPKPLSPLARRRRIRGAVILAALAAAVAGAAWIGWDGQRTVASLADRDRLLAQIATGPDGFDAMFRDVQRAFSESGVCGSSGCNWELSRSDHDRYNHPPGSYVAGRYAFLEQKNKLNVDFRVHQAETGTSKKFSLSTQFITDVDPISPRAREALLRALAQLYDFDAEQPATACKNADSAPVANRAKTRRFTCQTRATRMMESQDGKALVPVPGTGKIVMRFETAPGN